MLLVVSHVSFERRQDRSPAVRPVTVGVGNNEHPLPMVRGTKGGSGEHSPFRIIPERGQILQDDLNAAGKQAEHVFDDGVFRPDFVNDSCIFTP